MCNVRKHLRKRAVVAAATFLLGANGALGQDAYFTLIGDFNQPGDQHNFNVNVFDFIGSNQNLRFATQANAGGTTFGGTVVPSGGIDSVVELFDSSNASRGRDDDFGGTLDSLLSWDGFGSDVALNPNPLNIGDYRLNLRPFSSTETRPWETTMIGPALDFTFLGATPVGASTVDTLEFGTITTGAFSAVYRHDSGSLNLLDSLIVAGTGKALLDQNGGSITVGGETRINAGGEIVIDSGATFNANGDVRVDGGLLREINNGNFFIGSGQTLTAFNGGRVLLRNGEGAIDGRTYNVFTGARLSTNGFFDVGFTSSGTLNVDGNGSIFETGIATTSFWGGAGGSAIVAMSRDAQATLGPVRMVAASVVEGGSAAWTVKSGADATLGTLDINSGGTNNTTASLNIEDLGSTVTQRAGSSLTVGHASLGTAEIRLTTGGEFNSGDGAVQINKTGVANIFDGTFRANGDVTVDGGTIFTSNVSGFSLAAGKDFTLLNNATARTRTLEFNSNAALMVSGASELDVDGLLGIGGGSAGTATVTGAGSRISLLDNALPFLLGTDSGESVLTVADGGEFNTAATTLETEIRAGGRVNVTGGTFNSNAALRIDGGVLAHIGGTFNQVAGRDVAILNGGIATIAGDHAIRGGANYTISSRGVLGVGGQLNVGVGSDGVLTVSGLTSAPADATGVDSYAPDGSIWGGLGASAEVSVLNHATLRVGDVDLVGGANPGSTGTLQISSGADVTTGSLRIAKDGPVGGSGSVVLENSGSTLTLTDASELVLGHASTGEASVIVRDQAVLTSGTGGITVNPTGKLLVDGGTLNVIDSNLIVEGGEADFMGVFTLNVDDGRSFEARNSADVEFHANHTITDGSILRAVSGSTLKGPLTVGATGDGLLFLDTGASYVSTAPLAVGQGPGVGGVQFDKDTVVDIASLEVSTSFLSRSISSVSILNNANVSVGQINAGLAQTDGSGARISIGSTGTVVTQSGAAGIELGSANAAGTIGSLALVLDATLHTGTGPLKLNPSGLFRVDGGTANLNGPLVDNGGRFRFESGTVNVSDPAVPLNVTFQGLNLGTFNVAPNLDARNLTVAGQTIVQPGGNVRIDGGTFAIQNLIVATGGMVDYRFGAFSQTGPVFAALGSTLNLTGGAVTLGDETALNGVVIAGTVNIGDQPLTLRDANDVVFDSGTLLNIGVGGHGGFVSAANGLTLDFGANITGVGTIDTPDDPLKPFINNGHIAGLSASQTIELTGYVKGVGTLDNVVITGTDAPGFSPAAVNRGSVSYEGELEIELGGLAPGQQHDQLNHVLGEGVAQLGGSLRVQLIDGFQPALGDVFEIITAVGGISGDFASVSAGFEATYNATSVSLIATSALSGDYNNDGVVDAADYTVWRDNLGATVGTLLNDTVGMAGGLIDADQYNAWRSNFGATMPSAALAGGPIPEPRPLALLLLAACLSITKRLS